MSLRCGSEIALRENISKALELEGITAEVNFYRITEEQARSLGLKGSPSMLINGLDIQPANIEGFS
jgi:acylphosphatase